MTTSAVHRLGYVCSRSVICAGSFLSIVQFCFEFIAHMLSRGSDGMAVLGCFSKTLLTSLTHAAVVGCVGMCCNCCVHFGCSAI